MKKRPEREEARELYRSGKTYNEIISYFGVSKGTVSLWCGDLAVERRAAQTRKPKPKPTTTPRSFIYEEAKGPFAGQRMYHHTGRDGVHRVQLVDPTTRAHRQMSLARYLMSVELDRVLDRTEIVAHRDNNPTNDAWDNLVLTTRQGKGLMIKGKRECVICEEEFIPKKQTVETCSRACKYILISGILTKR